MKKLYCFAALICAFLLLLGCANARASSAEMAAVQSAGVKPVISEPEPEQGEPPEMATMPPKPVPEPTPEPAPEPAPEPPTVTIMAVGDDLIHDTVIRFGQQQDGSYNYEALFTRIKDDIDAADVACINQETILISDPAEYTNYPTFGSPLELGASIADMGFDVVTHATNHTYDKGLRGLGDTIEFWKTRPEVTVLGIHESAEDAYEISVIERNGINIALLNYTYGLNGFVLPSDKGYLVDLLGDEEKIADDVRRAEKLAEFTIVFLHAGDEYSYDPSEYQRSWAELLVENGADLIIGCHPHVVQPLEALTAPDGHVVPVFYSLGNYVSHQNQAARMLGAMANVTIKKFDAGVFVTEYSMTPLVTHIQYVDGRATFSTYKLADYTQELANLHGIRHRTGSAIDPDRLWGLYNSITG